MGWSEVIKMLVPGLMQGQPSQPMPGDNPNATGYESISTPLGGQYANLLPPSQIEKPYQQPFADPFATPATPFADSAKAPYVSPETAPYRPATAGVQVPQDYGQPRQPSFPKVQLDDAVQKYYAQRNAPPPNLSRGKAALSGLALAGGRVAGIMGQRNLDDKQAFGMAVGDALASVIGGLVAPKAIATQVKDVRENKALQDLSKSQEVYNQDVTGRYKEEQIDYAGARQDKTAAEILKMREDAVRKDEQLKVAEHKAKILQGESIRNAWGKTSKFSKTENPDDKSMSDQYESLIGAPLPDKDGDITDVDDKAVDGKLFRTEVRKSGVKSGFINAAGQFVDKGQALDFEEKNVTAAKVSAGASMYRTDSEKETNLARIQSALEIAKNKLGFDKEEFKTKIKAAEAAGQIPAGSAEGLLSGLGD